MRKFEVGHYQCERSEVDCHCQRRQVVSQCRLSCQGCCWDQVWNDLWHLCQKSRRGSMLPHAICLIVRLWKYRSLMGTLFNVRWSTQNLQEPSFLLTRRTGEENGLKIGQMMPVVSISLTTFSISFVLYIWVSIWPDIDWTSVGFQYNPMVMCSCQR